ncbi:MAG TPA: hypothetical protein VFQ98_02415 [Gallionella sp.]|nr:hypothetical protein [Gallionella sp.]
MAENLLKLLLLHRRLLPLLHLLPLLPLKPLLHLLPLLLLKPLLHLLLHPPLLRLQSTKHHAS